MAGRMPAISLVRDQSAETIRLFAVLPERDLDDRSVASALTF
jgi:hypothetical protein